MKTERVEVRLDAATREKLGEMVAARGTTVSGLVRSLIESSYEEGVSRRRLEAARRLGEAEVEDVPEPGELKRQFSRAYAESDGG